MKVKTQRVKKEILKTLDLEKKKEETPIDSDDEDELTKRPMLPFAGPYHYEVCLDL